MSGAESLKIAPDISGVIDAESLESFLGADMGGFPLSDVISHVYLDWPFNILRDSTEQIAEKARILGQISGVLKKFGIEGVLKFDYTCFGDHHLTLRFHKKLGEIAGYCRSEGISAFSVSDLYLAGLFFCTVPPYDKFSGFRVYLSHKARINKAIKLRYLDNMPFSLITLHHDAACMADEAAVFIKTPQPYRLEIPLNSGCLYNCPFEIICRAGEFHAEQEEAPSEYMPERAGYYKERCRSLAGKFSPAPPFNLVLPSEINRWVEMGAENFRFFTGRDLNAALGAIGFYLRGEDPPDLSVLLSTEDPVSAGCMIYD